MIRLWGIASFLALFILICSLSNCSLGSGTNEVKSDESQSLYLNLHDSVKYVGMETCKGCHADIHATFVHTGMGQSFDVATKEKSAARFEKHHVVYDQALDFYYAPFWKDEALYVKEYRLKNGDTTYSKIQQINYIVGSGQHTNSHLFEENGYIFQAPLTWYAQEKRWDLPPGYELGANSRFSRVIGMECMSCHNAMPVFNENSINRFYKIGQGIDCERCHGPGEAHVKEKRAGILVDVSKEIDYSIVNPSKLSWDLQVDLCQRCHLQGNAVLKPGKSFEDFRPGKRLSEVMEVYMPLYEGDEPGFIMASHAQRLQKSQCFIQSNQTTQTRPNTLTCITCHNPHVSVKVTGKKVFNDACLSCHQEKVCTEEIIKRTLQNDDCSHCHMPVSNTLDIPHVTVHDHYIRKPVAYKRMDQSKSKLIGLYAINNPNPDIESRLMAYLSYFEKFDSQPLYLDSALSLINKLKNPEQYRIYYHFLKQDYLALIAADGQYKGQDAWTNYRVGRAYMLNAQPLKALSFLTKALAGLNQHPDFMIELANCHIQLGSLAEADKLVKQALLVQPKLAQALNLKGYLHLLAKEWQAADEAFNEALASNPDYWIVHRNKISLFVATGKNDKAKQYLSQLVNRYKTLPPELVQLKLDLEKLIAK